MLLTIYLMIATMIFGMGVMLPPRLKGWFENLTFVFGCLMWPISLPFGIYLTLTGRL
jgi:hypothetical protein